MDYYSQNTSTSQLHDYTIVDVAVNQSHFSTSGCSNSEASAGSKIKTEIILDNSGRGHEDDVIIASHSVSESESVKHEGDQNSKRMQGFSGSPNDDASPPLIRSSNSTVSKPVKPSDANLGGHVKERMNSRHAVAGNAGVLAPSSLTPSSLNASSDEQRRVTFVGVRGSGNLPKMANVFRGERTKKTPPSHVERSLSTVTREEGRSAKRRCEELDSRRHAPNEIPADGPIPGGSKENSKVKASVVTVPGKNKRKNVRDLLDLGDSLASEMEQGEVVSSSRSFANNRKQEDKGKQMLEWAQSISIQNDSTTQRTPAKTFNVSCSSFLSARGARSKKALLQKSSGETSQACGFNTQASAANSTLNVKPSSGASFSAMILNHKEVLPLTAVSRGHQSKTTPSHMSVADALWLEEEQSGAVGRVNGRSSNAEEEDLFEGYEGEMLLSQCFEPVRDSEGFIRAREVPMLKVSVDLGPVDFNFQILTYMAKV